MLGHHNEDKILIYCWRGGLRSLSLYLVLKQIGFNVELLEGGYKSYRKYIVNFFDNEIYKFQFNQIKGVTGVGKTLFLNILKDYASVLDLEGIAKHKGSILGDIPKQKQPSQKLFETELFAKLMLLGTKKIIWVESESIKIGKLNIPSNLWRKMGEGLSVKLNSSLSTYFGILVCISFGVHDKVAKRMKQSDTHVNGTDLPCTKNTNKK